MSTNYAADYRVALRASRWSVVSISVAAPARACAVRHSLLGSPWFRNRDAWVAGLQQQPYVVHPCFDVTRLPFHFIGVGLSPAGAFAFFGIPMNELTNNVIELDMLAARLRTVHAQLLETPSSQARFQRIETMVRESMQAEI